MQIVQDKLEVFDKWDEWGCFFLFVHGLERAWNDPLLDLVVSDAFEDKWVELNQKNRGDLDGLDAFEDFEHLVSIDQSGKVYKQVEQFLDGYYDKWSTLFIDWFSDKIPDKIGIVERISMFLFKETVNNGGNVLVGFGRDDFSQLVSLEGKWFTET